MRLLVSLIIVLMLTSCVSSGPSFKKHSYETRAGRTKLKKYNDLYNGANRQFDYRIKRTKQLYKKSGYKN